MRRTATTFALAALVGAACTSTGTGTTPSGPVTVVMDTGGKTAFASFALAYFPRDVKVHAGDSVLFENAYTGEPHSVTLGTLVQGLLDASDTLDENDPAPPEDAKLPPLLPSGPGDAPQAAANPCYLAEGEPPTEEPCEPGQATQVPFDGTQAYYNSGFLAAGQDFEVELADDIVPGAYRYFCLLHRQGMQGSITVVDDATEVPTADDVEAEAEAAIDEFESRLEPAVAEAEDAPPGVVWAGFGSEDAPEGAIAEFLPGTVEVAAGDTVTFNFVGPHTVSFNPPAEATGALTQAPDGTWHANEAAFTPSPPGPPPGEVAEATTVTAAFGGGDEYVSSGIAISFPPELFSYEVTFTEPGTYTYVCLIHPAMAGTVTVA
ncbi:MAG TPA: plastocyanin/azurin family copper-binding protein [Actinomycetota bacterium]